MNVIKCSYEEHYKDILKIYNHYVTSSVNTYRTSKLTAAKLKKWFAAKEKNNLPVIGVVSKNNSLLGYGSYEQFRHAEGYKTSIEHSIYVSHQTKNKGVGAKILKWIVEDCTEKEYHCLVAFIDSGNLQSINLHEKFGFSYCGTIPQVGNKFERWLDVEIYFKLLSNEEI